MKKFLISVIIPCYNLQNYIEKTIESILQQTYKNYEIIIVNDGSTDNTLNILSKYISNKKIKIVNLEKNQGVSFARNKGIEVSQGEYILFLDGDDKIKFNLFEEAIKIFQTYKVDIFTFGYSLFENNKEIRKYISPKYNRKIFSGKEFLIKNLNLDVYICMCSFILKKEIISKNKLKFSLNLIRGEDRDFELKALSKTNKIYYTSDIYFYYLKRKNSAVNRKIKCNIVDSLKENYSYIENVKDKEVKQAFINNFCLSYFYIMKEIAYKGIEQEQFILLEKELKRNKKILKKYKFNYRKKDFIFEVLKILYYIDIKCVIFLFKILKLLKDKKGK